jgi:phenylalanyl-tRNA synthetase beta chain
VKISLQWLAELVSWDDSPPELAARLTAAGLNVEGMDEYVQSWPGVVVGKVVDCRRHPDADKLSLCRVDHGAGEPVQVVCGAPNVRTGLDVLLATVGSELPGGLKIKAARIRGVESHGMICSGAELGLDDDTAGIVELTDAPAPGTPADTLFGYHDTVLDIEVTPNRPDWLSHLGVAREVAALYGTKLNPPQVLKPAPGGSLGWKVEIENYADCPRYTLHGANGVTVGPSPGWLQNRLRAIGQRPINNVVDITNFVLFELGQPLHAFDRDRLGGEVITVRRAGRKQTVTTLDDLSRQILAEDLIIADGDGPVALAGVMGLASSQVDEQTRSLLLESAFFAPAVVRSCSRRLGLVSESSYRFEREADWSMVRFAAQRTLYLLQEIAGATIVGDAIDRADPDHQQAPDLALRVHHVNRILGTDLGLEQTADLLQSLGLKVQPLSSQIEAKTVNLMVQVPAFRRDLKQEIDLVEEIARLQGFDKGTRGGGAPVFHKRQRRPQDALSRLLRVWLPSLGYHEIVTSTFMSSAQLAALRLPDDDPRRECLQVLNPHHGRETLLRTSLVPAFIDAARRNLNAGARPPVRLFQLGHVFWPAGRKDTAGRHPLSELLPEEPWLLQIGLAGSEGRGIGDVPADLLELKGLAGQLSSLLGNELVLRPAAPEPFLMSELQWEIVDRQGRRLGAAGRVHPETLAALDQDHPAALLELFLDRLDLTPREIRYRPFARFPAARRDLSLLVPAGVVYGQIEPLVGSAGGADLESVELFDIYEGKGLPPGVAAYGIRLKFRSDTGSLKNETVDAAVQAILAALSRELQVLPRTL